MRSRDGDKSYLRRYCTLGIFFFSSLLCADEYFISYRFVVKDALFYNESLQVSKAMKKCKGSPSQTTILDYNHKTKLKDILLSNDEKFLSYISKLGIFIKHNEKTTNMKNHSTTILTLKTTCFKVDFNDNFVRISALK